MDKKSKKRILCVFFGLTLTLLLAILYMYPYMCCSDWLACPGSEWVIQCCTYDLCGDGSWCYMGGNYVMCSCNGTGWGGIVICPEPI